VVQKQPIFIFIFHEKVVNLLFIFKCTIQKLSCENLGPY
jgi:hypothetical protein